MSLVHIYAHEHASTHTHTHTHTQTHTAQVQVHIKMPVSVLVLNIDMPCGSAPPPTGHQRIASLSCSFGTTTAPLPPTQRVSPVAAEHQSSPWIQMMWVLLALAWWLKALRIFRTFCVHSKRLNVCELVHLRAALWSCWPVNCFKWTMIHLQDVMWKILIPSLCCPPVL